MVHDFRLQVASEHLKAVHVLWSAGYSYRVCTQQRLLCSHAVLAHTYDEVEHACLDNRTSCTYDQLARCIKLTGHSYCKHVDIKRVAF